MALFFLPHNTISERSSIINHMFNPSTSSLNYGCDTDIEVVDNSAQHVTWNSPDFFDECFPLVHLLSADCCGKLFPLSTPRGRNLEETDLGSEQAKVCPCDARLVCFWRSNGGGIPGRHWRYAVLPHPAGRSLYSCQPHAFVSELEWISSESPQRVAQCSVLLGVHYHLQTSMVRLCHCALWHTTL